MEVRCPIKNEQQLKKKKVIWTAVTVNGQQVNHFCLDVFLKASSMLMSDLKNGAPVKFMLNKRSVQAKRLCWLELKSGAAVFCFKQEDYLHFHVSRSVSSPQLRRLINHILVTVSETLCRLVSVCQETTCTVLLLHRHHRHCWDCILNQALLVAEMALVCSCRAAQYLACRFCSSCCLSLFVALWFVLLVLLPTTDDN